MPSACLVVKIKTAKQANRKTDNLIKDWNVNHRKVVDDDATEPLNVSNTLKR